MAAVDHDVIADNTSTGADVCKPQEEGVFKLLLLGTSGAGVVGGDVGDVEPLVRRSENVAHSRPADFDVKRLLGIAINVLVIQKKTDKYRQLKVD